MLHSYHFPTAWVAKPWAFNIFAKVNSLVGSPKDWKGSIQSNAEAEWAHDSAFVDGIEDWAIIVRSKKKKKKRKRKKKMGESKETEISCTINPSMQWIPSTQECSAARWADRLCIILVQDHPWWGELVEVGAGQQGVLVTQIIVAQVICHDENHMGRPCVSQVANRSAH